jgi:glycosyltransferase involved in cell wall biosynthesis
LTPSKTHLVLIPSYNPGRKGVETARAARAFWAPVWVVTDGSTDASVAEFQALAAQDPHVRVIVRQNNGGKGAAILDGITAAQRDGFTHVLTMDSDGQHPAQCIPEFMEASARHPKAMVLGVPQFDSSAPAVRVRGRRISNWATNVLTFRGGVQDSLFGFRVYPIGPLLAVMGQTRWMRRYDFDAEAAVRLRWRGVQPLNRPAPVRYFGTKDGGVSHFNYLRDNVLLTSMYLRLLPSSLMELSKRAFHRKG